METFDRLQAPTRDWPDNDEDLDRLVRKIFEIIPSYYDEREADLIRRAISEYVIRKLRQRE